MMLLKGDNVIRSLARARLKRDCALKSIEGIYAVALVAQSDSTKTPSFHAWYLYLKSFVDEFRLQQDVINNSSIYLNRADEFEQVDRPIVTSMESMIFEIKSIISPETSRKIHLRHC